MKVQLVTRPYKEMIGLARYDASLIQALDGAGIEYSLVRPAYPFPVRVADRLLRPFGYDLRTFFGVYPVAVSPIQAGILKHLTSQQMAILLWFQPHIRPAIVTVHDIVPYLMRQDAEQSTFRNAVDRWFDSVAMHGLKRADALISISHFTKETLVGALGCQEGRIHVVYRDVDHGTFRPLPVADDFLKRYGLDTRLRYVLYVGSENPRKNLHRLLSAFAIVREAMPEARLIKVGTPEYPPQAKALRLEIQRRHLTESVRFLEGVSDQDLVQFYNLADLFVFPSLYEGFGLPPLEAMACGTPVVCSNASSLPEVVGDAALTVDPYDVEALAEAMRRVLSDPDLADDLRRRGLERAAGFTWERTARETVEVYREVLS